MRKINIIQITKLLGVWGIYVYICRRMKKKPAPVKVPVFGILRTYHEVRNIFDNFGSTEQLRDKDVERYISGKPKPYIVDCGINVGVTVRWWFHLNPEARVYGIDMMDEAQRFTVEAVESIGIPSERYTPVTAALWSCAGKEFKVGVDDPLCGDLGFYRVDKENSQRTFVTKTLDSALEPYNIGAVDLLKLDLEGAGGEALKGAPGLIKKTENVYFEMHTDDECALVKSILTDNGFVLRRSEGRHQWWKRRASV